MCALGYFLVFSASVLRQIARYLPHHTNGNASKTHPKSAHDKFKTVSEDFTIPKQEATRKRAIPADIIKKVWELPYKDMKKGYKATCRYNLAKDCFILSFCLMGINSADLYNATKMDGNTITYYRTKTKDRRLDNAKMVVDIPSIVQPLIEKYKDKTGKRLFNFYQYYADEKGFNKAINYGLKEIGAILEVEDLEYYAARHSWATIALNKVGIDKYIVHAA